MTEMMTSTAETPATGFAAAEAAREGRRQEPETALSERDVSPAPPSPERILQLIMGFNASGIVGAAATYDLFTLIEHGIATPDALVARTGLSPRGVQALLDGLTGLGLLQVHDGAYANAADAASFLVEGVPANFAPLARTMLADLPVWARLPEAVRSGAPVEPQDAPEDSFWEQLVPAIAPSTYPVAVAIAELLRIGEQGPVEILDVGGGSGIVSAVLLAHNRQARATQLDWANVNRLARGYAARFGVGDRFSTIDGDLHTADYGAGYDIAIYANVAHQESPEDNRAAFRKLRAALRPGGSLVVDDFVLEDDRTGHPFVGMFHVNMLLHSRAGATWRRRDYESWLDEAGFADRSFVPTATPSTLILAR